MDDDRDLPKISRKLAKELGLRHYFTGKPCKRGHVALRFTKTRHCIQCNVINSLDHAKTARGVLTRKRYEASAKGKLKYARYDATAKRRLARVRSEDKRLRRLGDL